MPNHTQKDLDIALTAFSQVAPTILAANASPNTVALHDELKKSSPALHFEEHQASVN